MPIRSGRPASGVEPRETSAAHTLEESQVLEFSDGATEKPKCERVRKHGRDGLADGKCYMHGELPKVEKCFRALPRPTCYHNNQSIGSKTALPWHVVVHRISAISSSPDETPWRDYAPCALNATNSPTSLPTTSPACTNSDDTESLALPLRASMRVNCCHCAGCSRKERAVNSPRIGC